MLLLMLASMFSHTYDVFASLMLCVCYVQDMFRRLGDGPPVLRRLRCMHRLFFVNARSPVHAARHLFWGTSPLVCQSTSESSDFAMIPPLKVENSCVQSG